MNEARLAIKIRLNGVFQEVFDDDSISVFDEMTAKDVPAWDSLMHVILVVAVEKEFGIRLSAAQVGQLKNVGEIMELLERHNSR